MAAVHKIIQMQDELQLLLQGTPEWGKSDLSDLTMAYMCVHGKLVWVIQKLRISLNTTVSRVLTVVQQPKIQ